MNGFIKLFDKKSLLQSIPNILYTNLTDDSISLFIEFVCIDSRLVTQNTLFICYKGEINNGHDFIEDAVKQGATCIIVDEFSPEMAEKIKHLKVGVIYVKNTLETLYLFAKYKRNSMTTTKFIAVTGSSGKTTVNNMLVSCLNRFFVTTGTYKNYNNQFGVPLSILNLNPESNIAVLEIGTNNVGDIEPLSVLVSPDIAIITMIGVAHIGQFANGISDIIKEKASICKGLKAGGIVILNESNDFFKDLYKEVVSLGIQNIIRVGKPESSHLFLGDCSIGDYNTTNFEVKIKDKTGLKTVNCSLNGLSYHNGINILFAFAVARLFKIDLESIAKSINGMSVVEGRGNIEYLSIDSKKIMIVNDTYNCSFDAMKSLLNSAKILKEKNPNRRVVLFLGDIGETGDSLKDYHLKILEYVMDSNADKAYCVGEGMKYLFDALPEKTKGIHFKHIGALNKKIRSLIENDDICLFKAARSITMETSIEKLYMV